MSFSTKPSKISAFFYLESSNFLSVFFFFFLKHTNDSDKKASVSLKKSLFNKIWRQMTLYISGFIADIFKEFRKFKRILAFYFLSDYLKTSVSFIEVISFFIKLFSNFSL